MRQEDDNPVAQPEFEGIPAKENPEVTDEVHIPDYVMLDFASPEATATYTGRWA